MNDLLEIIFAMIFASAVAEWRRRRELKNIEKMLVKHYPEEKFEKLKSENHSVKDDEGTVSTIKWLISSDVRLAVRLEKARKKKEEIEAKIADTERRRMADIARKERIKARRTEVKAKAQKLMLVVIFIIIIVIAFSAAMMMRHPRSL